MKLELKHLVPYLPYGVEIYKWDAGYEKPVNKCHLIGIDGNEIIVSSYDFKSIHCGEKIFTRPKMNTSLSITKLVLRPLSDLTEEIEHNGKKFKPLDIISEIFDYNDEWFGWDTFIKTYNMKMIDYDVIVKLIEWHFDVFGLIDAGLAININTIK